MNKNGSRYESWLSANQLCPEPCTENDPFLSSVLLFLLTCVLCWNSASFSTFSNCLCCVCLTLRCPLISSLRQDLSFSPLLIPFKMQPHLTWFSPYHLPLFGAPSFLLFPSLFFSVERECRIVFSSPQGTRTRLGLKWAFTCAVTTAVQKTLASTVCMNTPTTVFFKCSCVVAMQ